MVTTAQQQELSELEAKFEAVFGNPELLALVVARTSAAEQRVTLPLVSRAWHAAAAAAAAGSQRQQRDLQVPEVPLWYVQRVWRAQDSGFRLRAAEIAAINGQMDSLKWMMRGQGLREWDACSAAAYGGQLKVLQWLRAQNRPWDADTCRYAAWSGHLSVLRWARQQDPPCPWDANTCSGAALNGDLSVLQWLRQ